MRKTLTVAVAATMLMAMFFVTSADASPSNGRKWTASYNAGLSAKYAAVPKVYRVGSKLRVCYRNDNNCVTVIAAAGSCTCFDLSDESFRRLAGSLSKGIITVTVTQK